MSEDEMQRKMEFIVEQQAQFTADIQKLQEAQVQLQETQAKTESVMLRLANALVVVSERQSEFASEVSQAQKQTQIQIDSLAERGKETDERLNALINTVERYIGEKRDGNSRN
ncbi:MAG: hypothetical protein ACR2LC_14540 [Pyrinomonadaceae bacterium]